MSIEEIKNYCAQYGVAPPNGLKKKKILYYKSMLHHAIKNNLPLITNTPKKTMQLTPNWIRNTENVLYYQPVAKDDNLDWITHFHTHGWTTVPIPDFDHETISNNFLSWIESMNIKFNRFNLSTWNNTPRRFNGIFKHYIGHEEFMWQAREATYPLFSQLWQDDNLLCSFDGASFITNNSRHKSWFHWDHSRWAGMHATVQGFVNLGNLANDGNIVDNGYIDGGLILLEGSQHIYDNYLERHPLEGHTPYFFANINDPLLSICRPIKICAQKGELVLWNSKMCHCNVPPNVKKTSRMCIYVSMQPRSSCTEKILNRRIEAANKGRMTNHWCGGEDFVINPRHANWTKDDDTPAKLVKPKLNKLRRKLIGY